MWHRWSRSHSDSPWNLSENGGRCSVKWETDVTRWSSHDCLSVLWYFDISHKRTKSKMYSLYFLVGCQSQVFCAVQGSLGAWLLTQRDNTDKSSVTQSSSSLQKRHEFSSSCSHRGYCDLAGRTELVSPWINFYTWMNTHRYLCTVYFKNQV